MLRDVLESMARRLFVAAILIAVLAVFLVLQALGLDETVAGIAVVVLLIGIVVWLQFFMPVPRRRRQREREHQEVPR